MLLTSSFSELGAAGCELQLEILETGRRYSIRLIGPNVPLGNNVDVSGNDLLLHWWSDSRTSVIGVYRESFGNPRLAAIAAVGSVNHVDPRRMRAAGA